jgi:hypothetical protein
MLFEKKLRVQDPEKIWGGGRSSGFLEAPVVQSSCCTCLWKAVCAGLDLHRSRSAGRFTLLLIALALLVIFAVPAYGQNKALANEQFSTSDTEGQPG